MLTHVTETSTPAPTDRNGGPSTESPVVVLIGRISRLELVVGAVVAAVMAVLVLLEPDILEAPFENQQTLLFTLGGTALAAVAFVAMLRLRVPRREVGRAARAVRGRQLVAALAVLRRRRRRRRLLDVDLRAARHRRRPRGVTIRNGCAAGRHGCCGRLRILCGGCTAAHRARPSRSRPSAPPSRRPRAGRSGTRHR